MNKHTWHAMDIINTWIYANNKKMYHISQYDDEKTMIIVLVLDKIKIYTLLYTIHKKYKIYKNIFVKYKNNVLHIYIWHIYLFLSKKNESIYIFE